MMVLVKQLGEQIINHFQMFDITHLAFFKEFSRLQQAYPKSLFGDGRGKERFLPIKMVKDSVSMINMSNKHNKDILYLGQRLFLLLPPPLIAA